MNTFMKAVEGWQVDWIEADEDCKDCIDSNIDLRVAYEYDVKHQQHMVIILDKINGEIIWINLDSTPYGPKVHIKNRAHIKALIQFLERCLKDTE